MNGKYIASVSFGKDSLAMLLYIIKNKLPLDEVVFYDTGMEFQAIYNLRDRVKPMLEYLNIKYTELKPKQPFLYKMLEKPVCVGRSNEHNGYSWCGGTCRWGTTEKLVALDKYTNGAASVYIGIAADEQKRLERLIAPKCSILAEAGMTEADCLDYCHENGFYWNEPTTRTEEESVELYSILDRVSCWCCGNKNLKELRNMYRYLPNYWERLKQLQSKIKRPFRRDGNTIFGLEERFKREAEDERRIIQQ